MSMIDSNSLLIDPRRIEEAAKRGRGHIIRTNILSHIDTKTGSTFHFKLENRQHTGSFKARGSLNKILLEKERGTKHVITASTGNHALGVARALSIAHMEGEIVLPTSAAKAKVKKLESYSAKLTFVEGSSLDAELFAKRKAIEQSSVWVSPYNDEEIIAGQGTVGIEILDQCAELDAVFITVGGGGLISGIATWIKSKKPEIQVIGCQPANSPEMYESIKAGKIIDCPALHTLSDGSAGGIEPNSITFPMCKSLINQFSIISENEIKDAIRFMHNSFGEKIEGAAAVAVASAFKYNGVFKNMAVVICGGNINPEVFQSILEEK